MVVLKLMRHICKTPHRSVQFCFGVAFEEEMLDCESETIVVWVVSDNLITGAVNEDDWSADDW